MISHSEGPAPETGLPFTDFFYLLRDYGVPVSMRDVLDLYRGLEKDFVKHLDDLFIFMRLTFVRRVEHMDAFERAFALYFYGVDIPRVAEGDLDLLRTKPFQQWLAQAIKEGKVPKTALWTMDPQELMKKFWETVREQLEAHNGGSRWVGTRGNSPFGHSMLWLGRAVSDALEMQTASMMSSAAA